MEKFYIVVNTELTTFVSEYGSESWARDVARIMNEQTGTTKYEAQPYG